MSHNNCSDKNLILGLVRGYNFEQIEPFLLSLKKTTFQGDVCFLVSQIDKRTINEISKYKVRIYPFNEFNLNFFGTSIYGYQILDKIYKLNSINKIYDLNKLYTQTVNNLSSLFSDKYLTKASIIKNFLNVYCIRYPLYYIYLSKYGKHYSNVMLTDVRDVLFQDDPFNFTFNDCICNFIEDNQHHTLSSCNINSSWLTEAFGEQAVAELGNQKILCSGVTIGTRSSIMIYLQSMIDKLTQLKAHRVGGIDQGIHNYIIYKNLAENVKLMRNYDRPVLTIRYEEEMLFNDDGFLVNSDGTVINVIHQYDRLQEYDKSLEDRILTLLTR